jgi:GNAT superfamily N-acetyltransferase
MMRGRPSRAGRPPPLDCAAMTPFMTDATEADVTELVALHDAVADALTARYGEGHWSRHVSAKQLLIDLGRGRVRVAREHGRIIATLRLFLRPSPAHRQWFTHVRRPLFLTHMAVRPDLQGRGLGRRCLADVDRVTRAWPAEAIRLDAYDAAAGAGGFYERCGYRECGRRLYFRAPIIYYERVLALSK